MHIVSSEEIDTSKYYFDGVFNDNTAIILVMTESQNYDDEIRITASLADYPDGAAVNKTFHLSIVDLVSDQTVAD